MRYLYKITNLINGKIYIGQTKDFKKRTRQHSEPGKKSLIASAIQKYGKHSFTFKIITIRHEDFIDTAEIIAIKYYKSIAPNGYNLEGGGNVNKVVSAITRKKLQIAGRLGKGKRLSEETKRRISVGHMGIKHNEAAKLKLSAFRTGRKQPKEAVQKTADANRGRKRTPEQLIRMGQANKGRIVSQTTRKKIGDANRNRKHTEETKHKMSASHKGKKLSPAHIKKATEGRQKANKSKSQIIIPLSAISII